MFVAEHVEYESLAARKQLTRLDKWVRVIRMCEDMEITNSRKSISRMQTGMIDGGTLLQIESFHYHYRREKVTRLPK